KLNFEFSQGFNPHPVMTIAQPLPVGVTSECDYMKVGLITGLNNEQVRDEINRCLPPGFKIYAAYRMKAKEIDLTKINMAEYIVEIECDSPGDINALMANGELTVPKKTKKGVSDSDIRPHIFEAEDLGYKDEIQTIRLVVSCGSSYNLKPETVVTAMEKYCDGFKAAFTAAHRKRMLIDGNEVM
ncbi:MAG: TIGR03936 family radical SAM-associated protein, partial [Candidatus Ornithomonoglobus sp.]